MNNIIWIIIIVYMWIGNINQNNIISSSRTSTQVVDFTRDIGWVFFLTVEFYAGEWKSGLIINEPNRTVLIQTVALKSPKIIIFFFCSVKRRTQWKRRRRRRRRNPQRRANSSSARCADSITTKARATSTSLATKSSSQLSSIDSDPK